MNKLELMRLSEYFDEGIDLSEFTYEEIREMVLASDNEELKRKYFEFYDDVKDKSLRKQDW